MQPILSNLLIDIYVNNIHRILDENEIILSKQLEYKFVKIFFDVFTKFSFRLKDNNKIEIIAINEDLHIFAAIYENMKFKEVSTYYSFDMYLIEDCNKDNNKLYPNLNLSTYVSELIEKYKLEIDPNEIIFEEFSNNINE